MARNQKKQNLARENHVYINLDKKLIEIVEKCVASIFSNGASVYQSKKDFVTKAIQQQIDRELVISPKLEKEIDQMLNNNIEGGKKL